MEESKDKELEGVNVRESIVTVKTVVTTTETVIKTVVDGGEVAESRERVGLSENKVVEEVDGGACDVGDVMVEVLGCDVFVDGVTRVGELGRGEVEFGDDGDGVGVDSTSCRKENVGSDGLRRDFQDSGAHDVDKERTVERVVEENSERRFGDGEVADNGTELSEDSSFRGADVKSNYVESNVPYPMTTTDAIPSLAAEQMVGTTEASFEIVNGEDRQEEADEQVDTEANAHGHGLVSEDKTVDGGIKSVEASTMEDHKQFLDSVQCSSNLRFVGPEIPNSGLPTQAAETDVSCETGQEKPVVRDSENATPEPSDMRTQVTTREFMDFANESITVFEPDMGMTGKLIQERLSFVKNENFNDSALAAGAGHENGALDEMKHVGTDMEIGAARGSEIHSESQLVDTKEGAKGVDNTLSKVSREETWVVGMDIDAVDAGFGNKGFVCDVPHDELKSSSENQESKGGFLVKCKTGMAISDESTKLSDSIDLANVDKPYMGGEVGMQNIDRNVNEGSSVSEADAHHISIAGNFVADLHTGFGQDGTRLEDDADQRSVLDDSGAVKGAIQEVECRSDASRSGCMDNPSADRVAQVGLAVEDNQEVQNAVRSERGPVDNVLAGGTETELLTDDVALMGSNTKIVLVGPDEQANIVSPSINESKIIMSDSVVSSMDDVAQLGSNMEVAEELHKEAALSYQVVLEDTSGVNDEPTMSSDVVTSATGAFVQNGSNVEEIEEVQEEAASAEGVVYLNNAAPAEGETPKQSNLVPSAIEDSIDDTQGGSHMVDENLIEGPFIVETEDPAEFVAGNAYVDVESDPTRDDNVGSDADVDNQVPSFQCDPLVAGFEHEPADHDVSGDSEMEDAQDEQEEACSAEQADSPEELEAVEEHVSGSAKPRNRETKNSKRAYSKAESLLSDYRVTYQLPPEFEGEFSVFDLVWGKVKSHPWWPGQIFHPSDSSEKAMKYFKKDCYFVAYFGDRTFAWNEASVLKPFRKHFSVAVRQNKTEAFQNAVSCALAEVSRRTELGLACSCISEEAYDKIRYQMVENTGVREKSSKREGVDRCTGLDYFKPDKLVEYVRSLAVVPTSGVDRLELVIAKAQLLAFSRLQGTDTLAEYRYYEGISSQVEHEDSATRVDSKTTLKGPKRKHNLKDIVYQRRREKSMTELMGETMYYLDGEFDSLEEDDDLLTSPTSGTKRKAPGFGDFTSEPTTKTISVAKVSHTASSNPQQSFKVGECIRRVASQLTGSPSILKGSSDGGNNECLGEGDEDVLETSNDSDTEMSLSPSQQSTVDEMLSQLHLSAQDPMKGYSFLAGIVSFFAEFRNFAVSSRRQQMRKGSGRKRKSSAPLAGPPESFEFDDRNDSYWTDMVVQNNAVAKPVRRSRKRKDEQVVPADSDKPPQAKPRKSSRKQYFHGPLGSGVETPLLGDEEQKMQLPTELMLNFTGMGSIPTAMNLNKMFRCFGPLKESETETDTENSRARVVFKKRSDAEVAYSSAAMFNIFGSTLVNYQLNYEPSVSFKTSNLALTDDQVKAT